MGLDVEILVNNAGFGDSGDFHKTDRERNLRMIELNCAALTDLQGRYLPPMVERGPGRRDQHRLHRSLPADSRQTPSTPPRRRSCSR